MTGRGFEQFDITFGAVFKVALVVLTLVFLYLIRDVLVILFIAFLLAASFKPAVDLLAKRLPRALAVTIVYLFILDLLILAVFVVKNSFQSELQQLLSQLSEQGLSLPTLGIEVNGEELTRFVREALHGIQTQSVIDTTGKILSGVVGFLGALVLSFYMLLQRKGVLGSISHFFPPHIRGDITRILGKIETRIGYWFRGELFLMVLVGLSSYIALKIIGVPFALVLALVAGLTEAVPTLGPVLGGALAALIAAAVNPGDLSKPIFVIGAYILIQQIENHFFVPQVMKRALGLNPVVIIASLLIGAQLLGVIGAILAIPTAASIAVIIEEWDTLFAHASGAKSPRRTAGKA